MLGVRVPSAAYGKEHMAYKDGDYERYHKSDRMKKERAMRNRNRREAEREGRVSKGDKREIDHIDGNPNNNSPRNLRVVKRTTNRKKQ